MLSRDSSVDRGESVLGAPGSKKPTNLWSDAESVAIEAGEEAFCGVVCQSHRRPAYRGGDYERAHKQ